MPVFHGAAGSAATNESEGSGTRRFSRTRYPPILGKLAIGRPTDDSLPSHYDTSIAISNQRHSTGATVVEDNAKYEAMSYTQSPIDTQGKTHHSHSISSDSSSTKKSASHASRRPDISEEIQGLEGVTSSAYGRYDRDIVTEKYFWKTYKVDPLFTDYTQPQAPSPWTSYVHPDGGVYFINDSVSMPILTDIYVYDPDNRRRLEDYITRIFEYIQKHSVEMPSEDVCLVLELINPEEGRYYFVDHKTKCLFWLEECDIMFEISTVRVAYTPSLVGNRMKSLYWQHNEYFPHAKACPKEATAELIDILIHSIGDSLTSSKNVCPYSLEDLQKMPALVKDIHDSDVIGAGPSTVIYRLLQNFWHERFLNLYGEQMARLDPDQSIHPKRQNTLLIRSLAPFLLFGPYVLLRKLQETSVDSLVRKQRWKTLQQDLMEEWKTMTLYATVLLNANVAFLAIQSVDNAAPPGGRSSEQRASYFSIMSSIGAIVIGLILVMLHTEILKNNFLANRSASSWGLETLALMYSLPYALLLWGMISFLVAFSIMCFGSGDALTIFMMAATCFGCSLLLLWCVSTVYEEKPFWYPWPLRQLPLDYKEGIQAGDGKLKSLRADPRAGSVPDQGLKSHNL